MNSKCSHHSRSRYNIAFEAERQFIGAPPSRATRPIAMRMRVELADACVIEKIMAISWNRILVGLKGLE